MRTFKKLLSLLLSVLLAFGAFAIVCFAEETTTTTETEAETEIINAEKFFLSLNDMIVEYDLNSMGSTAASGSETNRIIVKTETNETLSDTQGAVSVLEGWNSVHILQYSDASSTESALAFYEEQDYVLYAEMDEYYTFSSGTEIGESIETETELDTRYWGQEAIKIDDLNNKLSSSNLVSDNSEVVVAVFDSGINSSHAIFDDPDRILPGYNVFESNTDTSDGDEDFGHGTHVSGIIYESTLPNVKIRPYRVNIEHGKDSYSTAMTILGTAIYTAVELGDDVINVSMKWGSYGNNYLTEAIEYAYDNNVPLVAAAGNDTSNAKWVYPAKLDKVITVAAVDESFAPADFSNYGSCVDIAAPGVNIWSGCKNSYFLACASGTSMAAPFVSAVVASIKLAYPNISSDVLKDVLTHFAFAPDEWDLDYGTGVLDCSNVFPIGTTGSPTFSFDKNNNIVISSTSSNAVIYYTTDGKEPVIGESSVYTSPLSTSGISRIRAIAYEKGKFPSDIKDFLLKWSTHESIYYKQTVSFDDLRIPESDNIITIYSSGEAISVNQSERTVHAEKAGEGKIIVYLENNRRMTVNIEVEYNIFQWFIILFLWGFFWYI